jgi:hypothetical protein
MKRCKCAENLLEVYAGRDIIVIMFVICERLKANTVRHYVFCDVYDKEKLGNVKSGSRNTIH